MKLASLEVVEGAVPDRLEEPTREMLRFAALIQPLQRSHQCLLCKVFSVGGAAHHRQRHRVGGAQITSDECLQGHRVPPPRPRDEDRILIFQHPDDYTTIRPAKAPWR